jgi:hypothetical protein
MRYFFDTEFIDAPGRLTLISIGLVADDGREFYAVSTDFDPKDANAWVRANVLPKLPPRNQPDDPWMSNALIARRLKAFVSDDIFPEFWAWFAAYDWVLFCWLFKSLTTLPKHWPHGVMDLRQTLVERNIPKARLPKKPANEHHALADARWLRDAHAFASGIPDVPDATPRKLVGHHEIAEMAGVRASSVVHWRTRHEDFPKPVADLRAGPVYDRDTVRAWLLQAGKDVRPEPRTPRPSMRMRVATKASR